MDVTFKSDDYCLERINTEFCGFIGNDDGFYSFVYEQRDRKDVMIKVWQTWVEDPYDVNEFLDDMEEIIEEAIDRMNMVDWMVRV